MLKNTGETILVVFGATIILTILICLVAVIGFAVFDNINLFPPPTPSHYPFPLT